MTEREFGDGGPDERLHRIQRSRREFLKLTVAAASSAGSLSFPLFGEAEAARAAPEDRGNAMPGRIVIFRDPAMNGHQAVIARDRVEEVVHRGVQMLTGIGDTAAAFESLFPGLHSGSRFAVKVNCLAPNDTRWEVVRGVVSGLSRMLGGSYDVSRVTIYDVQTNLVEHDYDEEEFTFGGRYPYITSTNNCSSTYYVYDDHRLSNFILQADYVINIPVLKAHAGYPNHEITTAFKNHYGSLCPQDLCNDITGMFTVNTNANIKNKTCLVVTSALRGTYQGGPWEPPLLWNTFPERSPNTILFTTDPATEAYWCRDFINTERAARGLSAYACPWVEQASQAPYSLGISNPAQMLVIRGGPTGVDEGAGAPTAAVSLAPCVPNPFDAQTTIRMWFPRPARGEVAITDVAGRLIRGLREAGFPAGHCRIPWDGCDGAGRPVPAGVYFVRLFAEGVERSTSVIRAR